MKKNYPGFIGRSLAFTRLTPIRLGLALLVLSGGAWAQGLNPKTYYPMGNNPQSVVVGDFNADGKPDLATADVSGNTVSVLLNATCTTPTA